MPPDPSLDDHVDRLLASRARQGLPPTIDDPAAIDKVAALLHPRVKVSRKAAA